MVPQHLGGSADYTDAVNRERREGVFSRIFRQRAADVADPIYDTFCLRAVIR